MTVTATNIAKQLIAKFDIPAWCAKNGNGARRPLIHAVINALKAEGVTDFGATSYCFGGWYTFDLAIDRLVKAAACSHPSFVKCPEDLEVRCHLFDCYASH